MPIIELKKWYLHLVDGYFLENISLPDSKTGVTVIKESDLDTVVLQAQIAVEQLAGMLLDGGHYERTELSREEMIRRITCDTDWPFFKEQLEQGIVNPMRTR